MSNQPQLRIGDSEREAAVHALGDHFAEGRLTKDEYDERSSRAYAAWTQAELWPLFADLPRPDSGAWRSRPRQSAQHPGWWFGTWALPLLAVVVVLTVVSHWPLLFLLLAAWFVWARTGRHVRRNRQQAHTSGSDRFSRGSWA